MENQYITKERTNKVIDMCRKLVMIPSYSGNENEVASFLKSEMLNIGFDEVSTDKYGNVYGCINGNKAGKSILFDAHIDTVEAKDQEGWKFPPFGAVINDGKIYGRGTSDMKGAIAAMLSAIAFFATDTSRDFAGKIYFAGIVHEECFEGVAAREISKMIQPDYVIIGEASNCDLKIGQRGRAEIVIETFGSSCHSANPQMGINAVYKMIKIVDALQKIVPPNHPILGEGILELTDLISMPYPGASVIPNYCKATYDRRLLVGENRDSVLQPINEAIDKLKNEDPTLVANVSYAVGKQKCYTGETITGERFFPGWIFDKEDEYIIKIHNYIKKLFPDTKLTKYNFCTNGSHYAGEAGISTIGCGPSLENLAHIKDEFIEIDQLAKATRCYQMILDTLAM